MIVNATEEGGGHVFACTLFENLRTSGMLFYERGNVMDETSNQNEGAILRFLLD